MSGRAWTAGEDAILRQIHGHNGWAAQVGVAVGRSEKAAHSRANQLGLYRVWTWTPAADEKLVSLRNTLSVVEIAQRMKRSPIAIAGRIQTLGLSLMDHDGWYSTADAGLLIGRNYTTIGGFIRAGTLTAKRQPSYLGKEDTCWMISRAELRRFIVTYPGEVSGRCDLLALIDLLGRK